MSWFDYFSSKSTNEANTSKESPETVNPTESSSDAFLKDYINNLNINNNPTANPNETFDQKAEEQKIKQQFKENPVTVSLDKTDLNPTNQHNNIQKSLDKEDVQQKVENLTKEESINKVKPEDAYKMVKDRQFIYDYKYRENRIEDMAKENCVDLEVIFRNCLSKGPYLERLTLCFDKNAAHEKCVRSQKDILEKIGYGKRTNSPYVDSQLAEAAYDVLLDNQTPTLES